MIGVTIGVGSPFRKLADLAAACVEKHTGLTCHILNETHFNRSGLKHPAALRLAMFEYFNDSDILYFDADWLCMNSWDPLSFLGSQNVIACRDFTLDTHYPKQEYAFDDPAFVGAPNTNFSSIECGNPRLDLCKEIVDFTGTSTPFQRWPNTGLLLLNRRLHSRWLQRALTLYCSTVGHHLEYFEQPALIKALDDSDVSIDFLPRKYNVLAIKKTQWPRNVVGLHVKLKHHPDFIQALLSGQIQTPEHAQSYFLQ